MNVDENRDRVEKRMGLVMLGTVVFCVASGGGIGVFFEAFEIGVIAGGIVGIIAGLLIVPGLMRDYAD